MRLFVDFQSSWNIRVEQTMGVDCVQTASLLILALRTLLIKVLRQQPQAKDCRKPSSFITTILSLHKQYPSCDTIFFIPATVFHHATTSATDTRGCQKGHANGGRLLWNLRPCWLCLSSCNWRKRGAYGFSKDGLDRRKDLRQEGMRLTASRLRALSRVQ